ncbi:MAG: hypothetical protein QOD42_1743 [Sphingomonadales bacterium]|nr:hypothetical protein [Sphingomonadales bacterium]
MGSSEPIRRGRPRALPPDTDLLEFLLGLPPEAREQWVRRLGFADADAVDRDWPTWAHDGQQVPPASPDGCDWSTCVVMGGRGFGKTRAGSEWIVSLIREGTGTRTCPQPPSIALVGATLAEARRVMVEGRSGLLEVAGPWIREWRPSLGTLKFRDGAVATLFSGASPELLRGPEHDYAWCDELAKWEKAQESWDMLQFGLRLGTRPRALVTTTPRPGPVLRAIMASPGTIVTGGPSDANPHTSAFWRRDMAERYAGTRLARQELDGELLTDTPGALWTVELLETCRAGDSHFHAQGGTDGNDGVESDCPHPHHPRFTRIIIGVDPPSGDGTCGIIACARDEEGRAHILADHSVTARSPEGWSRAVAEAAMMWGHLYTSVPVRIVAEKNQGGLMVAAVLRTADPDLRVRLVTATCGKSERAEPVAMLFEAGKVTLHGEFPKLEAELLGMIAGGDYEGPGLSPDRADAMVWALTELMLGVQREPRVRAL